MKNEQTKKRSKFWTNVLIMIECIWEVSNPWLLIF